MICNGEWFMRCDEGVEVIKSETIDKAVVILPSYMYDNVMEHMSRTYDGVEK